jgi:thiamine monophosphate synthase
MPGDRPRNQQKIGMTGTRDKPDPETFEVIERIVERVDFKLAAIARTGIDVANAERAAEDGANMILQGIALAQALIRRRRSLRDNADRCDLTQCFQHKRSLQVMTAV